MAIGTYEKAVRTRAARDAENWRLTQYGERDGFGYESVRPRPLPSQLLFGLLFARMLDRQPDVAHAIGTAPSLISVRVPCEQAAEVLLKVAPYVVQARFPRRDKERHPPAPVRKACGLKEHDQGYGGMRKDEARERLASGASVLYFWHENAENLPPEFLAVLTDSIVLSSIDLPTLRWLGRIVTGEPCRFPIGHPYEALTPSQVDVAFAYGLSAHECQRRVQVLTPIPKSEPPKLVEARPTTLREFRAFGPATDWGIQLADDLAAYKAGDLSWNEVDRGVLLHGAPGVGKTTFARTLAATCDVPLIATSVAEWYSKDHLGATLKRIRSIFAEAAKMAPCIVFIDEIDGIGDRQNIDDRNRDYWTQIINCALECLDGTDRREGVVVLGACNDPERVDAALRRPGRLDRSIRIPLPDSETLELIYKHHLGGELSGIDLGPLAATSVGRTGAEVEQLVRLAKRAARKEKRPLALHDLVSEVRGPAQDMSPATLRRTVVHEAGHAVAAIVLNIASTVTVSIGNGRLGATRFERPADHIDTRETALNIVRQLLAGRAAEEEIIGEVSAGAGGVPGSDLEQATRIVAALEGAMGLGEHSWLTYWSDGNDTRRHLFQPHIAKAVETTLTRLYEEIRELVAAHRESVLRVADALQTRFHLSHADLIELISDAARSCAASDSEAA
ncbi:AAA family ATPase [Azorhizobium sp. AG788]|uniref:AAA family ATPase n=1 Tax=Azorhizobium sp. AG788 TaxID=2183897 RepID=UPI0031393E52